MREITRKVGVDVVFEHSGQDTWPTSVAAMRWGGRLVVCGASTGYEAVTDLRFLWNKQQNLLGSHLASKAELAAALRAVEAGHIKPVIDHVFPLQRGRQGAAADGGPEGAGQARLRAVGAAEPGTVPTRGLSPRTMASMLRLAVIGHIEWVTFANAPFVPGPGEIVHLTDPLAQPGGGGAVTAVALQRMGAEVTFYTALGSDERAPGAARAPRRAPARRSCATGRRPRCSRSSTPAGERTLYVVGENDAPSADRPAALGRARRDGRLLLHRV